MQLSLLQSGNEDHRFIQTTNKPLKGVIPQVSLILVSQYLWQVKMSHKQWKLESNSWKLNYEEPIGYPKTSKSISYKIIAEFIRTNKFFDPQAFNLPLKGCVWLDSSTDLKLNTHMYNENVSLQLNSGDLQTHHYGEKYPVKPILKREGHLYTSVQPQLMRRIMNERKKLIDRSNESLTDDWVFDLRALISDTISLVDIALNQLYIKAEYDPLPNWDFDSKKLGSKNNRRMDDKLKWVRQISGKEFNIENEKKSLDDLRLLRNHLMHFDPPSLVITLEEATIWLNQIIDVGQLLVKYRKAINVDISIDLANFLLQEEATFVPLTNGRREPLNQNRKEDYYSSIWPF